jgi:hypothetical protein
VHACRVLVSYAPGFALAEIAGFPLEWPLELPADRFLHVVELGPTSPHPITMPRSRSGRSCCWPVS